MPKLFAILIPIFSIILTTLIIVLSDNNAGKEVNKKGTLIFTGIGLLLLIVVGVILIIK